MFRHLLESKIHRAIAAFGVVPDSQPAPQLPRLVFVDAGNRAIGFRREVAVQAAAS